MVEILERIFLIQFSLQSSAPVINNVKIQKKPITGGLKSTPPRSYHVKSVIASLPSLLSAVLPPGVTGRLSG